MNFIQRHLYHKEELRIRFSDLHDTILRYRSKHIDYNKVNAEVIDLDFVYSARSFNAVKTFNAQITHSTTKSNHIEIKAKPIWFSSLFGLLFLIPSGIVIIISNYSNFSIQSVITLISVVALIFILAIVMIRYVSLPINVDRLINELYNAVEDNKHLI